jgi:hypothetical protein
MNDENQSDESSRSRIESESSPASLDVALLFSIVSIAIFLGLSAFVVLYGFNEQFRIRVNDFFIGLPEEFTTGLISALGAGIAIAVISQALLRYLEPSKSRVKSRLDGDEISGKVDTIDLAIQLDNLEKQRRLDNIRLNELQKRIKREFFQIHQALATSRQGIPIDEQEQILKELKTQFLSTTSDEILSQIKLELESSRQTNRAIDLLEGHRGYLRLRSEQEIRRLERRGNINLLIGILGAMAGVVVLFVAVLESRSMTAQLDLLLAYFLPRVSLALFIEFFAFFFLRLYKISMDEIKYFHNELTNSEFKFASVKATVILNDLEAAKDVLLRMADTERNSVLNEGQTTLELEKERLTATIFRDLFEASRITFSKPNEEK